MSDEAPKEGYRYLVTTEFEAIVLTHWIAPFTDGDEKLLPVGLEFTVINDPSIKATAVSAKPDQYQLWQAVLAHNQHISAEKYGGYSLVIPLDRLETHCSRR